MHLPKGLSWLDKFFLLPVGLILMGTAAWNWAHGLHDAFTVIWFLIGFNNLLLIGQKAWPRYHRLFTVLVPVSGFALILASAYLLFASLQR